MNHINKEIAEHSRIYWTYQRNNRRARDYSHGWGHNPQWSTDFRRDYLAEDALYFNVDGDEDLITEDGHLEPGAASLGYSSNSMVELITHRCFIQTPEQFYDADINNNWYVERRET